MHTHAPTQTSTHTHIYTIQAYKQTHAHTQKCMHKLVCRHTHTHPHKHAHIHLDIEIGTLVYTQTHTHKHAHTHLYTQTHTRTCTQKYKQTCTHTLCSHTQTHTGDAKCASGLVSRGLVMLCVCPPRRVTGLQGVGSGGGRASLGAPEVSLLHQSFSSGKLCINQRWGPPGDRGRVR